MIVFKNPSNLDLFKGENKPPVSHPAGGITVNSLVVWYVL